MGDSRDIFEAAPCRMSRASRPECSGAEASAIRCEAGTTSLTEYPAPQGLYDSRHEHDSCGVGFVAHIKGARSHAIVGQALEILANLDHRGAVGADPLLGDGAGILLQIPDPLYRRWATGEGLALPAPGEYAVAMCFLPQHDEAREFICGQFEKFIAKEGQHLIGWRDVPTTEDGLGQAVRESMPVVRHCFIARGDNCADQEAFERRSAERRVGS